MEFRRRHHRAHRRHAAPSATSSGIPEPSRSSPSTPTGGCCSSASGACRPDGRCSRSRPGRSTCTTASIEDPDVAARRELEEETGYRAATLAQARRVLDGARVRLRADAPLPRRRADRRRTPTAWRPTRTSAWSCGGVTLDEAIAMVDDGEIGDAKSIVGHPVARPPAPHRSDPAVGAAPASVESGVATPPAAAGDAVDVSYGYTTGSLIGRPRHLMRRRRSAG